MIKCVIFDFDNTIVNTTSIQDLRNAKAWETIQEAIKNCEAYSGIIDVINKLRTKGILVAIVSNAPKQYLLNAIKYFSINVDYIVGYHDVKQHKPNPDGINKVLNQFSLNKDEVVFVGNEDLDYFTSTNAGISFAAVPWGTFSKGNNDFFSLHNKDLTGSLNQFIEQVETPLLLKTDGNLNYLGYYQGPVKSKILDFKSNKQKVIDEWNAVLKYNIHLLPKINFIVRALGHRELSGDNNSVPLSYIAQTISTELNSLYIPQLLKKKSISKKSTSLTQAEREKEIHGKYFLDQTISNKHLLQDSTILIIDDVYTSGATTREISRAIHNEFPQIKCIILTLVRTYFSEKYSAEKEKQNENLLKQLLKINQSEISSNKFYNKNFTANYSNTNHNFVIQNLISNSIKFESALSAYLPGLYILKNLLQRGVPTLMSKFLQSHLGALHKEYNFNDPVALIDKEPPIWRRTVKGFVPKDNFPAIKFLEVSIPNYFKGYEFIQQLLLPEVPIKEIVRVERDEFDQSCVDFYLPQANLVIEVDGSQHKDTDEIDSRRDNYLRKYGVEVFRISSEEVELENESFLLKIAQIIKRIETAYSNQLLHNKQNQKHLTIGDYSTAFLNETDLEDKRLIASSVIRMQLLMIEMLENQMLQISGKWEFEIKLHDVKNFVEIAIEDLFLWLENLYQLQKISFKKPEYKITYVNPSSTFSSNINSIKIDFSLLKRYTDEFQTHSNVVFVRTHYLDTYQLFKHSTGTTPSFVSIKPYDFFQICTTSPLNYKLNLEKEKSDYVSLLYFLKNIFLQDTSNLDFNEGQFAIIANALSGNDTIGLLPTGSGKSVCYQMCALLQPAVSFVVCPIKSLMYDQKADLDSILISRTNYISSEMDASDKNFVTKEFSSGKYFFIFISPERFQTKAFRNEFAKINTYLHFGYAIIDEVHCLSEWGHDFRTSYLNLSNTIHKFAPTTVYIGLTATASVNVLKDIQTEFNIDQLDVKTPLNYTRKELDFDVLDDNGNKGNALIRTLKDFDDEWKIFENRASDTVCGLIFTQTVNGGRGCFSVSNTLSTTFKNEILYYCGSPPKALSIEEKNNFESFKRTVQNQFKDNKSSLLVATKAFGMGINKGNIHYTIHYGLPSSMESLYQEAGRAARDKQKFASQQAKCLVLLTKEFPDKKRALETLWDPQSNLSDIQQVSKGLKGDLNTNLFMLTSNLDTINDEYLLIKKTYALYCTGKKELVTVYGKDIGIDKAKVEKVIYRLYQLGIVKDWTIENFFNKGIFSIEVNTQHNNDSIIKSIYKVIHKYETDFSLDGLADDPSTRYHIILKKNASKFNEFEKHILVLLIWSYEHFVYNRKQSLKNVYEICTELISSIKTKEQFKESLESYFRFNESSYILQYIAENPTDIKKWFCLFYDDKDNSFILHRQQLHFKDQLSRFLESYMQNPGLDMISGLIRILLDDYENTDGRKRMEASLAKVRNYEEELQNEILENILRIGKEMDDPQRKTLSKALLANFDTSLAGTLYEELNDDYSLAVILDSYSHKIKNICGDMENKWRI